MNALRERTHGGCWSAVWVHTWPGCCSSIAAMHLHRIVSALLVGAALLGTPLAASAEPVPIAEQAAPATTRRVVSVDDAASYAQREQQSPNAAKFEGGSSTIYIGGGAVTVLLVVLLIVLIL